ncbi:acyltransferase ChoActase/COT/CPT [Auriscalpium vulgare]|uniref:Acyltransferase ChoActase/COT/CPT n=1 Tax=Auriscalpium vulgare TaxID=40419 RepID=A0ACB8RK80_9AGAM|nr:acyltransferase ChoActase/COT/CPT [Auriscalpium vulgare]
MLPSLRHKLRTTVRRQMVSTRPSSGSAPAVKLPRLPVPDLQRTLNKYVQSLAPLLEEEEARGGPSADASLEARFRWATEFEQGAGGQCQQRLIELDRSSPRNWLDDNIWLKKAYHEWRAPLLVNSNWWLAFFNDTTVPVDVLREHSPSTASGLNAWQIRRAAWLIHRTIDFKDKLERQEIYPDTTRTGIWFRETVAKMFHVCRIPQIGCDTLAPRPASSSPGARNVLVMVHDWMYTIPVYDKDMSASSLASIERRLRAIVWDVSQRLHDGKAAVAVGLLSSDERDRWAKNLQHLLALSPQNEQNFEAITQAAFAVSLDAHTLGSTTPSSAPPPALESREEIDFHLQNIRSSHNAHNRWFDKAYTLIVESNTRAGAMGEHSPCDALVPSIVAEYAIVESIDAAAFEDAVPKDVSGADAGVGGWERLDWVVDGAIVDEVRGAEARAQELIADSDDSVLWFTDYGADWMKGFARLSPDAYVQMALQLAWYKTRGTFTATYETVLTRVFDRGRTETIRTLTADSRAFVLAMVDPTTSVTTRHKLLNRAIQTHTGLTREAATGKGIDRHLLGLRLMLPPGEQPKLFNDPMFDQSQSWKLSTSGLSAGHLFRGTGFGASYHDGYGINYLSGPDMIKFGIESKHSCAETSTAGFQAALVDALREMKAICTPQPFATDTPVVARL